MSDDEIDIHLPPRYYRSRADAPSRTPTWPAYCDLWSAPAELEAIAGGWLRCIACGQLLADMPTPGE